MFLMRKLRHIKFKNVELNLHTVSRNTNVNGQTQKVRMSNDKKSCVAKEESIVSARRSSIDE